ncbi:hypothetical protein OGAPHI_000365 [Ogataea philodendri]|uniref:Cytidyltransferase-like domain-containing protein n=1 Tax=Ogataea philodendri TaxID=1378263 RepID=A0A9P8TAT1_9ASCO|nr:uncharacterized protein OGAPHI_000365 [Ogataea philodendri]KAH3671660.1 hypothetical protein OGAPHI_000365 [Ogataea philodendri]
MNTLVLIKGESNIDKLLFIALSHSKTSLYVIIEPRPAKLEQLNLLTTKIYELAYFFNPQIQVNVLYRDPGLKDAKLVTFDEVHDSLDYPKIIVLPQDLEEVDLPAFTKPSISVTQDATYHQYEVCAVGGTFDHLHSGHKILLTAAVFLTKTKLIVGVTGPELLKNKKYAEYLESYEQRVEKTKSFIKLVDPAISVEFFQINDVCGPTASIKDIDALVLSSESAKGGQFINSVRSEKGFPLLTIHEMSILGGDQQDNYKDKLSSTQLRKIEYEKDHGTGN